jgi:hypothetical protein
MKKYRPNTEKYLKIVIDAHSDDLTMPVEGIAPEVSKEISRNIIFNLKGPRQINIKHSPKTLFLANKLFRPMSEILKSIESIENISVYMRTFPYKKQDISKVNYLCYHIENYLHEIYILYKRMEAYKNIIKKEYKAQTNATNIESIEKIWKSVDKAMKGIINMRGWHTHRYRYAADDLDSLATIELFVKGYQDNKDKPFYCEPVYLDRLFRQVRQKRVKDIKESIKNLGDILEIYFKALLPIVSRNGKIVYPNKLGINKE